MDGEIVVRIRADGGTEIRVFADSREERDDLFQRLESCLPQIENLESSLLLESKEPFRYGLQRAHREIHRRSRRQSNSAAFPGRTRQ
jgi:hypothetical protein